MMKEQISAEETRRLAAVKDLDVLNTTPDPELDALTQLLARLCDTPIAAISIIDADRLFLKSKVGVSASELPRFGSPCTFLLGKRPTELMMVPDTLLDERFINHLLVTGETKVRMYAGAPLVTPEGEVLGTLCVLDQRPRELSELQLQTLQVLASHVMTRLVGQREERERQRMARKLQDAEQRWHLALASSNLGVWDWHVPSGEVFFSDLWCTMLGYAPDEISHRQEEWSDRVHPEDLQPALALLNSHLEGRTPFYSSEHRILAKDGSYRWILDRGQVFFRDEQGKPLRVVGTHMDITEQKQAAETLRISQENMATAQRIAHFGSWERELDVRTASENASETDSPLHWSDEMYRIAGLPAGGPPMTLGRFLAMVPEEDRQAILQAASTALENRSEYSIEHRLIRPDGTVRLVHERAQLIFASPDGPPVKWVGIAHDITEQRQAEASHRASEERFQEMADKIGEVFYNYDALNHRLVYANQAYERISGIPRETVYADPFSYLNAIHPEDFPLAEEALHLQMAGQETNREFRIIRPDGEIRWVHEHGVPVLNSAGQVERIVGTARDITEGKLAEEKIRQSEERFRLLAKATNDAIWDWSFTTETIWWNEVFETLFGYTPRDTGNGIEFWHRHLHPEDREGTIASIRRAIDSGDWSWSREYRFERKDGRYAHVLDRGYIIRDDEGNAVRMIGSMSDQTERKQMEQQILRVQRMESLGTLAGGISHDLNNVLAPILMSIEILQLQETQQHKLNILKTIEASARRGADMVKQVLSFARGIEGQEVELQISHQIKQVEKIANETFLKNIQVRSNIPSDLWPVQGDPTQIHQVLLNLCVNARDAMPNGGTLILSARNCTLDHQYVAMHGEAQPGPYVMVQVEDTGNGMTPEILERIFEPFFTTKELGKGTGLGLSTTLAIIRGHGGFIQVHSQPGRGTRFDVCLPAVADAEAGEDEAPAEELIPGEGESILVIDDEDAVRDITQQTLEAFGYKVLTARDGAEAIGLYATHRAEISLVLTDMMMPVMDGASIIRIITRMNPEAKIIAASGLNANNMAAKAATAGVRHFIPKPYTAGALLKTVRQVLTA